MRIAPLADVKARLSAYLDEPSAEAAGPATPVSARDYVMQGGPAA